MARFALGAPFALGAALAVAGCGGRAVDGPRLPDEGGEVRLEALPQRLTDCEALRGYVSTQGESMLAAAPTGSPFPALFAPSGESGFRAASPAEWPGAKLQSEGRRLAYTQRADASDFYVFTDDGVAGLTTRHDSVYGNYFTMPASLQSARSSGAPAWIFSNESRLLVVGTLDLSRVPELPWSAGALDAADGAPAGEALGTFFWQLDVTTSGMARQQLRYVDAELLGARATAGSVQAILRARRPSRLELWNLTQNEPGQAALLERARSHNRERIAQASGSDWLPQYFQPELGGAEGASAASGALLDCSDIFTPATDSGLNLLTWLDVPWARGLDGWRASGLYTGEVQVVDNEQRWTFVTEPWWSVSESSASALGHESPETIVHTFEEGAGALGAVGSIAVRGAPLRGTSLVDTGASWFLATHAAYGPALGGQDEARIWSFRAGKGKLEHLGTSSGVPFAADQRIDFAPGVAYVHGASVDTSSSSAARIDLSDPGAPGVIGGPGGFFRVLPWRDGQHLLVSADQIRLQSGTRDVASAARAEPSNEPVYADAARSWLVEVASPRSYRHEMRFARFTADSTLQPLGTFPVRTGYLFPPLIESDQILSAYFRPRGGDPIGPYGIEIRDASTFQVRGGIGGGR